MIEKIELKKLIVKYLFIHPFLLLISCIDKIYSFFYEDKYLSESAFPSNDAILSRLTDPNDPKSPYRF